MNEQGYDSPFGDVSCPIGFPTPVPLPEQARLLASQIQVDRALLRQSLAERVKYPGRRASAKQTPLGALLRGAAKRRGK